MEKNENISENTEELDKDISDAAEESTDTLDEDDAASEYNDTASQFSDLEDALAEANDKYVRLYAEYDNYRKRTAKEKTETYQNATAQCVEKLLPVLDSFERSLEAE
jgi:molecular chaperone GrpE